jgi:hypothetical protein
MNLLFLLRAVGAPAGRTPPVRSCRSARRIASTRRPSLECLEDRITPSNAFVTTTIDDVTVPGTLRYAVANAQNGDTIVLKTNLLNGPIVLTGGELVLNHDLTLRTSGSGLETISGGGTSRVFEIEPGAHVSLSDLLITDGNGVADNSNGTPSFDGTGGGILNFGTLTVTDSTLASNNALTRYGYGGAIYNRGTLTLSSSTLSSSTATNLGGGIFNDSGTLTVSGSTLSGNTAANAGGGIYNYFGTVTVSSSTVSDNSTRFVAGGGIYNFNGTVTVSGSTLSNNFAAAGGGGIRNYGGTVTISDSILFGNVGLTGGGGIANNATLSISGSTLSGNAADDGGGIFNQGALTVTNSTVSGNNAKLGGDLYEDIGATFALTHSTISDIYIA